MSQLDLRGGGDVDFGRVIRRTADALRADAISLLLLSALLIGLPALIYGLLRATGASEPPGEGVLAALRGASGETLVTAVLSTVYSGAATYAVLERFAGRGASPAELLSAGLRFFPPLFGLSILTTIGIGLGLILLIVPGLYLMTAWLLSAPVRVGGGPGVLASMERSAALSQGHRWRVFGLIVLAAFAFVIWTVALGALGVVLDNALGGGSYGTELIANPLVAMVGSGLTTVGPAALYEELRLIKEGPDASAVAEVFA